VFVERRAAWRGTTATCDGSRCPGSHGEVSWPNSYTVCLNCRRHCQFLQSSPPTCGGPPTEWLLDEALAETFPASDSHRRIAIVTSFGLTRLPNRVQSFRARSRTHERAWRLEMPRACAPAYARLPSQRPFDPQGKSGKATRGIHCLGWQLARTRVDPRGVSEQRLHDHTHLHACERRTRADVDSLAIQQICGRIAVKPKRLGISKARPSRLAETQMSEIRSPTPMLRPPISTGQVVMRRLATSGP